MMRSKDKLKFVAEMALMYSIPDMTAERPTKSRLGGLYTQLQKVTGREIGKFAPITEEENDWLRSQLEAFGLSTGWESTPKHISTVLSFSVALAERREDLSPRVLEKLNLLIDHLESGGDLRVANCWAGSLAMEKWDAIFGDAPPPGISLSGSDLPA